MNTVQDFLSAARSGSAQDAYDLFWGATPEMQDRILRNAEVLGVNQGVDYLPVRQSMHALGQHHNVASLRDY